MKISTREKRFLIAGTLAVVAYLGGVYGVEPFVTSQGKVQEAIRENQALMERHQLLASERDRYQRKAGALRAQVRQAVALHFKAEKPPVAAAEIQGMLHRLGQEAGVTIIRQNIPAPKKVAMFTQVMVELSVHGELRAIRDFLYRIHTAPKMLLVPKLVIRGIPARVPAPLSADLQVAGYMLGGEENAAAAPSASGVSSAARAKLEKR